MMPPCTAAAPTHGYAAPNLGIAECRSELSREANADKHQSQARQDRVPRLEAAGVLIVLSSCPSVGHYGSVFDPDPNAFLKTRLRRAPDEEQDYAGDSAGEANPI
jgi:hypothetical protein